MKIIQVIDLDGTTVKVDETNPSEPKIVAALQFDVATRKAVPIAEVAELIFTKPLNANVEAVCIGYKGVDGKHYGLVDDMFAPVERNGFIELTIPSDYAGNPELKIRPRDGEGDNFNQNELYNGADLNNGIYATLMKARSLGIPVEDYITDKVVNVDIFERAQETYENIDPDLIDKIYSSPEGVDADSLDIKSKLDPNECFILKSVRNSVLARYNPFTDKIKKVDKGTNFGIQPRNAEQSFAFEVLNDPNIKLVGLTGKAGTGKTLLALASALKQAGTYKQILLARPIVALANKDLGFLPGDEKQKVAPYMQPLFDNLNVIKTQFAPGNPDVRKIDDMQKNNQLVIEALAFIRGRSLSETYCIIDEAQNLTPHEIKTIITRAGEGTKMVFTGDIQQIDSPYLDAQSNGLAYMIDKMKGQDLFAHINLIKGERSELSELASDLL